LLLSATIATATITNASPLLDRKIDETTEGLPLSYNRHLHTTGQSNAKTIVEYITAAKSEVKLSDNYRRDIVEALARFSRYNDNRPFRDITRVVIITFLDSLRKTEAQDPMHKWIGTCNLFRIYLLRFFKWLYYPDIEPGKRPKPSVIDNIAQLKRKEKSIYKPSDL
jgi:hypothetical protein